MKIIQLQLEEMLQCSFVQLKFPINCDMNNFYISYGLDKCTIISTALQLICSHRFATEDSLQDILPLVKFGRLTLTFMMPVDKDSYNTILTSIDDDPCTSAQAIEREQRRRLIKEAGSYFIKVTAMRDFRCSDFITYSIDDSATTQCLIAEFQVRFFSCTDIILPHLQNVSYGEYCNGNWLELLSYNYIYGDHEKNELLEMFSTLYANGQIPPEDSLITELTSNVIQTRISLHLSRISNIILLLDDVRKLFEYISCSEYTVWFLLVNENGDLEDVSLSTHNINFHSMKTVIEMRTENIHEFTRVEWTDAEKYVQEILLVSIQLAFGAKCKQNIVYLHSLEELRQIEIYEFLSETLTMDNSTKGAQVRRSKNYLERIVEMSKELNLTVVIEYESGIPVPPKHAHLIHSIWNEEFSRWDIALHDNLGLRTDLFQRFIKSLTEETDKINNDHDY